MKDIGGDPSKPETRLYTTNAAQPYHTDSADVARAWTRKPWPLGRCAGGPTAYNRRPAPPPRPPPPQVGLLCLRNAMEGGDSNVTSSVTVFNEAARRRPDLVPVLLSDFYNDRKGEARIYYTLAFAPRPRRVRRAASHPVESILGVNDPQTHPAGASGEGPVVADARLHLARRRPLQHARPHLRQRGAGAVPGAAAALRGAAGGA